MKLIFSSQLGYCSGVQRSLLKTLHVREQHEPVFVLGQLVHNNRTAEFLALHDVISIASLEEARTGTVVVRAHGLPPQTRAAIKDKGLNVCDATCPRVLKLQTTIKKYVKQGYAIIILGEADHPEVKALLGIADSNSYVLATEADLESLPSLSKAIVVAQTTFNRKTFHNLALKIKSRIPECFTFDTTCDETQSRYDELVSMKDKVDAVIVIGDRHSRNTNRLTELGRQYVPTFQIEKFEDLNLDDLFQYSRVGIVSGASTPLWVIQEVVRKLQTAAWARRGVVARKVSGILQGVHRRWLGMVITLAALTFTASALQDLEHRVLPVVASIGYGCFTALLDALNSRLKSYGRATHGSPVKPRVPLQVILGGVFGASLTVAAYYPTTIWATAAAIGLLSLTVLGQLPLVPKPGHKELNWQSLNRHYLFKDSLTALQWTAITVLIPRLSEPFRWNPSIIAAASIIFLFTLLRAFIVDLREVQTDVVTGWSTVPAVLGVAYTKRLIVTLFMTWLMAILMAWPLQMTTPIATALLFCPLFLGIFLFYYRNRTFELGLSSELLLTATSVTAGIASLAFEVITNKV